jgi:ATP-dependent DNA ligase
MVFDIPVTSFSNYQQRLEELKTLLRNSRRSHPFIKLTAHQLCESKHHSSVTYEHILAYGGEGIIVRLPESQYIHGYSHLIYKFKVLSLSSFMLSLTTCFQKFKDAEALVIRKLSPTQWRCKM